jgi:proteasome lid subunit RPN8/RPN11
MSELESDRGKTNAVLREIAYHIWKPRPLLRSIHWKPAQEIPREATEGPYEIFLDQRVFSAMHQHVWNARLEDEPFGYLVGDLCEDPDSKCRYVIVSAAVPSRFPLHENEVEQITGEAGNGLLSEVQQRQGVLAGWYHRHRVGPASLSEKDLATHERLFREPWQVAFLFVTDPWKPSGGCFGHTPDGLVTAQALQFYEMVGSESLMAKGMRRSRIDWANVTTLDSISIEPLPRPEPPGARVALEEAEVAETAAAEEAGTAEPGAGSDEAVEREREVAGPEAETPIATEATEEISEAAEEAAEEAAAAKEEAARQTAELEAARMAAEREAARRIADAAQAEDARRAAEEEAARQAAEAAVRAAKLEAVRVAAEEEAARRTAELQATREAAETAVRAAEEEAARSAAELADARTAAEKLERRVKRAEAARQAAEEEARELKSGQTARMAAEEEAAREAGETAVRTAELEAARMAAEEEAARRAAELQATREAAETAVRAAEEEAARSAAELAEARTAAEELERRVKRAEAARQAAEEEARELRLGQTARMAAEEEATQRAEDMQAGGAAEAVREAEAAREAAEKEAAQRTAELQAAREVAEAAMRAAEEQAELRKAEAEARMAAEEEAARRAAELEVSARAVKEEAELRAQEVKAAREAARLQANLREAAEQELRRRGDVPLQVARLRIPLPVESEEEEAVTSQPVARRQTTPRRARAGKIAVSAGELLCVGVALASIGVAVQQAVWGGPAETKAGFWSDSWIPRAEAQSVDRWTNIRGQNGILTASIKGAVAGTSVSVTCAGGQPAVMFGFSQSLGRGGGEALISYSTDDRVDHEVAGVIPDLENRSIAAVIVDRNHPLIWRIRRGSYMSFAIGDGAERPAPAPGRVSLRGASQAIAALSCSGGFAEGDGHQ